MYAVWAGISCKAWGERLLLNGNSCGIGAGFLMEGARLKELASVGISLVGQSYN